ncbi:hypothetical protein [Chitinophaga sp. sic0106]|uniref:hypothetical protein n=1 Tax=Chitinophaga sp. sic0106 TaxID=2854785 RepID=UPI001C474366|nr:hypothetical protein [Chitinophaga sp. sic0106]MBV7534067.1 hypothetical protein [Chitinophaga sp. sic0106]
MNRDAIIDQFARDPEYKAICLQVAGDPVDADDLYQELCLFVLEITEDKLRRLNESCLKCFFYRMAQKQFNSKTSAYHKKFRRDGMIVRQHAEDINQAWTCGGFPEDLLSKTQNALDEAYWYDAGVMKLYVQHGTLKAVSELTEIPIKSLHNTITTVRKVVRKKVRKYE